MDPDATYRTLIPLVALALACGDSGPPPASPIDGGEELACIDEANAWLVPCPDEPLCWSRRYELPKVCADDETPVDLGPRVADAGPEPMLDAGPRTEDAGPALADAFEPEPDAYVPPTLDPRLETWPSGGTCDTPGELLVGANYCVFQSGNVTGGVTVSPVKTGPAGRREGESCTLNSRADGDHGDCYAGSGLVCFDGSCRNIAALDSGWCPSGTSVVSVGHETRGVCLPE